MQKTKNQTINKIKKFENELFFNWIDDLKLKTELTEKVKKIKSIRTETQQEYASIIGCSLTKLKQIENGTCKDFNAINNYLNFYQI